MGEVRKPQPVKFFVGILTCMPAALTELRGTLEEQLGSVDIESPLLEFVYTDYYEPEMGAGLKRKFWGFSRLASADALVDLKLFTNRVEQGLAVDEKRTMNIDPGYLTAARIVLASTKDFSHRLYLGKGIYGEVTLVFEKKDFRALPWTYPDYRSEDYLSYFRELRKVYIAQSASSGSMSGERNSPAR
jgi:Domain of unknown function (DUF4416)